VDRTSLDVREMCSDPSESELALAILVKYVNSIKEKISVGVTGQMNNYVSASASGTNAYCNRMDA
jgi:hypothetical protein